jgi:5-methylthioadenosine/S-adenosylhomocysteine deaminase
MLASGTIAFSDMYFNMHIVAQAAEQAGVKANLSNAVLAFSDDYNIKDDNCYKETLEVINTYNKNNHSRIKAEASLHCAYTTNEAAWRQVTEFALEHNLRMHVHLSETKTEHQKSIDQFGLTPAQVFGKYGVFDIPTVAAHACWVTEGDIAILAEKNVTIAHNPVSNLKLASGIAPIEKMLKNGINIALGTDGMASNNTHDLFEEIKLASILQKCATENPTALRAEEAIKMATINGALAQGRENTSGKLAIGYDADLIMLDFDTPRQIPCFDPMLNLAYSTTGQDVILTMCQGKILYENGEYTTIDIERTMFDVKNVVAQL